MKKTTSETSASSNEKKKSNSLESNDTRIGNGPEAKLGKTVNYPSKIIRAFFLFLLFGFLVGCCLLYRST